MRNILNFKLFENSQLVDPKKALDQFELSMEDTKFKDIISKWIKFEKKRTGRIYLVSNFLPSVTFMEMLDDNVDKWFFTYSSAGRYYGEREKKFEDLMISILEDCIIKYLPSGINKKRSQEIIRSEGWLEKNIDPDINKVISNLRKDYFSGNENISDLRNIMTPLMKKMKENKTSTFVPNNRENSLQIYIESVKISEIMDILEGHNPYRRLSFYPIKLIPSANPGIMKTMGSNIFGNITIKIGVNKIGDYYDKIDSIIMSIFDRNPIESEIDNNFLSGFFKYLFSTDGWRCDKPNSIIYELSKYCGKDIERLSKIKNLDTLDRIIKMNKMEKFENLIKLNSQGLF